MIIDQHWDKYNNDQFYVCFPKPKTEPKPTNYFYLLVKLLLLSLLK